MWRTAILAGRPANEGDKDGEPWVPARPEEEQVPTDLLPEASPTSEGGGHTSPSQETRAALHLTPCPSHHTPQDTSPSTLSLQVTLFSMHFHDAAQTAYITSTCMDVLATPSIRTSLGGQCLHSILPHTLEQCENSIPLRSTETQIHGEMRSPLMFRMGMDGEGVSACPTQPMISGNKPTKMSKLSPRSLKTLGTGGTRHLHRHV